jgi:hypothetical protein
MKQTLIPKARIYEIKLFFLTKIMELICIDSILVSTKQFNWLIIFRMANINFIFIVEIEELKPKNFL